MMTPSPSKSAACPEKASQTGVLNRSTARRRESPAGWPLNNARSPGLSSGSVARSTSSPHSDASSQEGPRAARTGRRLTSNKARVHQSPYGVNGVDRPRAVYGTRLPHCVPIGWRGRMARLASSRGGRGPEEVPAHGLVGDVVCELGEFEIVTTGPATQHLECVIDADVQVLGDHALRLLDEHSALQGG